MSAEELQDKLMRRFGPGDKPMIRRALYERLGRIVEEYGDAALHVIATAAADAVGRRNNGRYFAFVVMRRLVDRGILPAPEL